MENARQLLRQPGIVAFAHASEFYGFVEASAESDAYAREVVAGNDPQAADFPGAQEIRIVNVEDITGRRHRLYRVRGRGPQLVLNDEAPATGDVTTPLRMLVAVATNTAVPPELHDRRYPRIAGLTAAAESLAGAGPIPDHPPEV